MAAIPKKLSFVYYITLLPQISQKYSKFCPKNNVRKRLKCQLDQICFKFNKNMKQSLWLLRNEKIVKRPQNENLLSRRLLLGAINLSLTTVLGYLFYSCIATVVKLSN